MKQNQTSTRPLEPTAAPEQRSESPRPLRLKIELLEARVSPQVIWGDCTVACP